MMNLMRLSNFSVVLSESVSCCRKITLAFCLSSPVFFSACTDYVAQINEREGEWNVVEPTTIVTGFITDFRDGQSYKTVTIGSQIWMAQNLNYNTLNSYCYNDSAEYCTKYGRLYTWAAAMDSAGRWSTNGIGCGYDSECSPTYPVQGVCPSGWHLPTITDFEKLFSSVGGSSISGRNLKSSTGWLKNGNGTDTYLFSALPAGRKFDDGKFVGENDEASFWSSTEFVKKLANSIHLDYDYDGAVENAELVTQGFSIRCLKDESSKESSSSSVKYNSSVAIESSSSIALSSANVLSSSSFSDIHSSSSSSVTQSDVDESSSSKVVEPVETSSSAKSSSSSEYSSSQVSSSSSAQPIKIDFYNGADISEVQEYERNKTKFFDVDGKESDIFTILKNHGFNSIRLRTFVSPKAKYGYAASGCGHDAEAYGDKEHVVAYAKKVKAAGMGLLVDIHYSDVWADPGKQIIPERWRGVNNANAMADSVYAYTKDLMLALKNAGATPDMVQVGNETTPGILIHKPNSKTDCWGNGVDKAATSVNGDMGTAAGKANAAKYFNAGIKAVKEVSPTTKTVLHIERIRQASTVNWWMGVVFDEYKIPADVMGFSAYTAYGDGTPDNWKSLFNSLTSKYSKLEFIVAEYNGGDSDNHYKFDGSRKKTREMISGMNRWIGTFFWEPTIGGAWGAGLFDWKGKDLYANVKAFEEFY